MAGSLSEAERTARIRQLNDALRRGDRSVGRVLITSGVNELGAKFVSDAVEAVAEFAAFTADNDPYGEHDFGAFDVGDERLFFKIDYFDRSLQRHSPDAADPAVTVRVLTIMLAHEY